MPDRDPLGLPALYHGIRSGRAGFVPRLALSLASAALLIAAMTFLLGLADQRRRVQEEHVAVALGIGGVAWCASLLLIWSTYGRWRHVLTTVFICIGVLVATIALACIIGITVRNSEFLIASTIFMGLASLVIIIAAAVHRGSRGRTIVTSEGAIDVRCPQCQYSLTGLDSTKCPECGHHPTIDQLIHAQDYEGIKRIPVASPQTEMPALPSPA